MVDEPELICFKGTFKLASEPRGVARTAALAAAEMALVSRSSQCCLPDLCMPIQLLNLTQKGCLPH